MKIPKQEYFERIAKFQANMKKAGLDACLVHGTESDFANVRYLSEYWPTFEQAGVFVPATGDAILLIGPESEKYARGRSVLDNVHLMLNYRESAEPDYPGIPLSTFDVVAKQAMGKKKLKKLGLVGTACHQNGHCQHAQHQDYGQNAGEGMVFHDCLTFFCFCI